MPFLQTIIRVLSQLINLPKVKQQMAKGFNLPVNMNNATFKDKVQTFIAENPVKSQLVIGSALAAVPSVLTDVFTADELPIVAAAIEQASKPAKTDLSRIDFDKIMGDQTSGIHGADEDNVMSSVDIVSMAIDTTDEISDLLGIPPSQVPQLVKLIASYEPSYELIYKKIKG